MVVWRISPEGNFLLHDKAASAMGIAVSVGGVIAASVPVLSAAVLADLEHLVETGADEAIGRSLAQTTESPISQERFAARKHSRWWAFR